MPLGHSSRSRSRRTSSVELDVELEAVLRRSCERSKPGTLWDEADALLTDSLVGAASWASPSKTMQPDMTAAVPSYPFYSTGKLKPAAYSSSRAQSPPYSTDRATAAPPFSSSRAQSPSYSSTRQWADGALIGAAYTSPYSTGRLHTPDLHAELTSPYSSSRMQPGSPGSYSRFTATAAADRLAAYSPSSSTRRSPARPRTADGSSSALHDTSSFWAGTQQLQPRSHQRLGKQLEHGERLLELHSQLDALTQQLHHSQQAVVSVAEQNRHLKDELSGVVHKEANSDAVAEAMARRNKKLTSKLRRVLDAPLGLTGAAADGGLGGGYESTVLQQLQDDRRRLQAQVERLLAEQDQLRYGQPPELVRTLTELREQRQAVDEQNAIVAEQERTIRDLKAVTRELTHQCEFLRAAADRRDADTAELRAKCSRMADSEAAAKLLREQLKRATDRADVAQKQLDAMRAQVAENAKLRSETDSGAQERHELMQRLMDANVHINELHAELGPRLLRSPSPHDANHYSSAANDRLSGKRQGSEGGGLALLAQLHEGASAQPANAAAAAQAGSNSGAAAASGSAAEVEAALKELGVELLTGVAGAAGAAAAPQVDAMGLPALLALLRRGLGLLASKTAQPKLEQARAEAENEGMKTELADLARKHAALLREAKAAVTAGEEAKQALGVVEQQHGELKAEAAKSLAALKEALAKEKEDCERLRQEAAKAGSHHHEQQQHQQHQPGGALAAALSAREHELHGAACAAHLRPVSRSSHVSWGGAAGVDSDDDFGEELQTPRSIGQSPRLTSHLARRPSATQLTLNGHVDSGFETATGTRDGSEVGSPRSNPPPVPFGERLSTMSRTSSAHAPEGAASSYSTGTAAGHRAGVHESPRVVSPLPPATDRAALVAAVLQRSQQHSPSLSPEPSAGGSKPSDRAALVAAVLQKQQSMMTGRTAAVSKQASMVPQGLLSKQSSTLQSGVSVTRLGGAGVSASSDRAALVAAVLQKQQSRRIMSATTSAGASPR